MELVSGAPDCKRTHLDPEEVEFTASPTTSPRNDTSEPLRLGSADARREIVTAVAFSAERPTGRMPWLAPREPVSSGAADADRTESGPPAGHPVTAGHAMARSSRAAINRSDAPGPRRPPPAGPHATTMYTMRPHASKAAVIATA